MARPFPGAVDACPLTMGNQKTAPILSALPEREVNLREVAGVNADYHELLEKHLLLQINPIDS